MRWSCWKPRGEVVEPEFPVDAVYTWVDSGDPAWRDRKETAQQALGGDEHQQGTRDCADNRFRDNDELRYSLRSLAQHAPWIRRVFLVTDQQRPAWINDHQVTVVDHREIFPKPELLPVFSSTPIEMCVHRIPEISEHFISLNDDFFLGRAFDPDQCFTRGGKPRLWVHSLSARSRKRFLHGDLASFSFHQVRDVRAHRLIHERFQIPPAIKVRHYPRAIKKSIMEEIWSAFPEVIERNMHSKFRSRDDIIIMPSLYAYYAYATKQADFIKIDRLHQILHFIHGGIKNIGTTIGDSTFESKLNRIARHTPVTFCINDGDGDFHRHRTLVQQLLQRLFPQPSIFERQP